MAKKTKSSGDAATDELRRTLRINRSRGLDVTAEEGMFLRARRTAAARARAKAEAAKPPHERKRGRLPRKGKSKRGKAK